MGQAAIDQARHYEWGYKADQLIQIYQNLLKSKKQIQP
jgi:hypothetical protein